ncbi:MAG: copper resistance protein B [Novosphingobium sp.]
MKFALALALAAAATPAFGQEMDHSMHDMAGMDHSVNQAEKPAESEVGNAAPPPVPTDHAARQFYPIERIDRALADLSHEGKINVGAVFVDQLEYRAVKGGDAYGWKAQAFYGGDIDRAALTTEGEGQFGHAPERAEVSALWRHTFAPYFNLEAGVRHDFNAGPQRTYAVLGVEGLAPYWIEVEGQLLVSNKGDVHARLAASHDMRITQNLILQPDVEVNVAFQDVPALGIGAGFERIETGARLRYQFTPEFGPYVGVHWERKLGGTARLTRVAGESASAVSAVAGVRFWF